MLNITDLSVEYLGPGPARVNALDGISLRISAFERVGLVGESGSGKSTLALSLVRALPLATRMRAATLRFMNTDILTASSRELRNIRYGRIAVIFQHPGMALNPCLTIARQVQEVIRAHQPRGGSTCRTKAMAALEEVFGPAAGRISKSYPHELSGGERQRVSIAQAVACRPDLIVADEPTSALDSVVQAEILDIFRRLAGVCAMLFMTHDARLLAGIADRVVVLRRGRVVEEGDLMQMYRNPGSAYTAGLLAFHPVPREF